MTPERGGNGLRVNPRLEIVPVGPERCFARIGSSQAAILEGLGVDALAECLEVAVAGGVEEDDAASMGELVATFQREGMLLATTASPREQALATARVTVLANGDLGEALAEALRGAGLVRCSVTRVGRHERGVAGSQSSRSVMRGTSLEGDSPIALGARPVDLDPPALDALVAANELLVCGLEGVEFQPLLDICRAIVAGRRAGIFVVVEPDRITVGPTTLAEASACLACSRLSLYPDDELRSVARSALPNFGAYRLDSLANGRLCASAAAGVVVREASRIFAEVPRPELLASVCEVDAVGGISKRAARSLNGCPICAPALSVCHPAFRWAEGADANMRPSHEDGATATVPTPLSQYDADEPSWFRKLTLELGERGASQQAHSTTSLQEHLLRTYQVLCSWGQPRHVCRAGLLHSVYGTNALEVALFQPWERKLLGDLIGVDAELLACLFGSIDRARLARDLDQMDALPPGGIIVQNWRSREEMTLAGDRLVDVLTIDLANAADQAHGAGGGPGLWMAGASHRCGLLRSAGRRLPFFAEGSARLGADAEVRARDMYLESSAGTRSPSRNIAALEEVVALNPFVGEPHLMLAGYLVELAPRRAMTHVRRGLALLGSWATAWDKRAPHGHWIAWGEALRRSALQSRAASSAGGVNAHVHT